MPTTRTFKIALLPGDGVGPEVIAAARSDAVPEVRLAAISLLAGYRIFR